MNTTVIVKSKHQVIIPQKLLRHLGVDVGDILEAKAEGRKIVFTPKQKIDYSQFPTADDEYTPTQRRYIDKRLALADADIKAGRVYGPFATVAELERSMRDTAKKFGYKAKSKRSSRR